MKRIVIIGAGPTGLGAAYRLKELGHTNFIVFEKNRYAGGLCASFRDDKDFTWDLGGHVIFSKYEYFNKLIDNILKSDYIQHRRIAWVRTMGKWIPYPFQNNLKYLPRDIIAECLRGLKRAARKKRKITNFKEWILDNMGEGIAKYFMLPYNLKTWAYPVDSLSYSWIADRVSRVDIEEVIALLSSGKDKTDWGPNAMFKFPLFGGTGEIFRRLAKSLDRHIVFDSEIKTVDVKKKKINLFNGKKESYDILVNTSPLDRFVKSLRGYGADLSRAASGLKHNSVFVVGLGVNKPCPSNKCWMYFPDDNSPFFRTTYFSNYSPNNVPDNKKYYSMICESAYSEHVERIESKIVDETIQGLINSGLLAESDRRLIVSQFLFNIHYAYPIPTLDRDNILRNIQPKLQDVNIYSRGRFGSWKYEIGNTDHSVMQGKEIADKILKQEKEKVWTL